MLIDACTFNSLSIRGDTVIRDISSVVSASFNRRFENLSLSLSLFHAVTVCRRTPRHRRGEEEVRPCGRIGRHVGETAIKKKPAKAVE